MVSHVDDGAARVVNLVLGLCHISVEAAGPGAHGRVNLVPNHFREMAGRVIQQCVVGQFGMGGFETVRLENLVSYVLDRSNVINNDPTSHLRKVPACSRPSTCLPRLPNSTIHYLLYPDSKRSCRQVTITG